MMFLNYFKALNYAPKPKGFQILPIIAGIALFYLTLIISIINSYNLLAVLLAVLCAFVFLSGLILSNYFNSSPNLYSLIPISSRKSLLYRFLSVLFMTLLMIVIAFIVLCVIFLIVFLFSLIPSCNGDVGDGGTDTPVEITYHIGLYGGLFFVAYFIFMYSAGMLIGLFKTRKARNTFSILLFVCTFIAMMGTCTASEFISPFVNACFEAMAMPWLCILFWFIVAAAMLGAAIYMGIKHYDPKKF